MVLVIGYGNELRRDDGLGPAAARAIAAHFAPPAVEVILCHQLTPELAAPIARAGLVIFVDARRGGCPGTLHWQRLATTTATAGTLAHYVDPATLLHLADVLYQRRPSAIAITVSGDDFGAGDQLSACVRCAIPELTAAVARLIDSSNANKAGFLMHEYAIVESIVSSVTQQLKRQGVEAVKIVRLRRGSAFSEEALRQAYDMLAAGTPLENAALDIETVNLDFACGCGHRQVVNSDDLVGHMFICPGCGAIKEIDEAHDLELLGVEAAAASQSENDGLQGGNHGTTHI